MSYQHSTKGGLMGLGAVSDDQDPVQVGAMANGSPILSLASLAASDIMVRMASVPRSQRVNKMISILNGGKAGLGYAAKADYARRLILMGPRKKDQAMFDAIRAALADELVGRTLAGASVNISGLGQTVQEVMGGTSKGVNDANALFCSFGAGTGSMVGGFLDQFGVGGSTAAGSAVRGSQAGGAIAGCNAGQLVLQGQLAQQQAQLAQSGAAQTLAMQQASDARFTKMVIGGVALVGLLGLGYVAVKKL